jgi:hypothetical protein
MSSRPARPPKNSIRRASGYADREVARVSATIASFRTTAAAGPSQWRRRDDDDRRGRRSRCDACGQAAPAGAPIALRSRGPSALLSQRRHRDRADPQFLRLDALADSPGSYREGSLSPSRDCGDEGLAPLLRPTAIPVVGTRGIRRLGCRATSRPRGSRSTGLRARGPRPGSEGPPRGRRASTPVSGQASGGWGWGLGPSGSRLGQSEPPGNQPPGCACPIRGHETLSPCLTLSDVHGCVLRAPRTQLDPDHAKMYGHRPNDHVSEAGAALAAYLDRADTGSRIGELEA